MYEARFTVRRVTLGILASLLAMLGLVASASAQNPDYEVFENCPSTNPETLKCLHSVTEGGEVVLGKKTVPIVNPAVIQAGYTAPVSGVSSLVPATDGVTLSKSPQPVPGGLLGLVPPAGAPPVVKALVELFAENGLTGVTATLELARPVSEAQISESNLAGQKGVALKLPVKMHLENPFLGSDCYVGSSAAPIIWNLTTGKTSPPPPNESIQGAAGAISFLDGGRIARLTGSQLVDNAWSAPSADGCASDTLPLIDLSALVDPIIDLQVGLPSAAGMNTATLEATSNLATAVAVNNNK